MTNPSRDQGKYRPAPESVSTSESTSPTFATHLSIPHRSSSTKKLRRKRPQKQAPSPAAEEPSSTIASPASITSAPTNPRWRLQNALSATIRAVTPEFERRELSREEDRHAQPPVVDSGSGSVQQYKSNLNIEPEYNMSSVPSSPGGGERSPRSSSRKNREQQQSSSSRARAGSSNEIGQIAAAAAAALRPRTRTLEGRASQGGSREASPHGSGVMSGGGLFGRNRSRLNSTSSAGVTTPPEDVVITSIGIPSTIPQPVTSVTQSKKRGGDGTRKLGKMSRGAQGDTGPLGLGMAQTTIPEQVTPPQLLKNGPGSKLDKHGLNQQPERTYAPDMQKILQLMKSSRGRMEGQLAFRRFDTTPWSLSYCSVNDETGSLVYEPKGRELLQSAGASTSGSRSAQNSISAQSRTLIPDLRGCAIAIRWDMASGMPYMDVHPQNSTQLRVHLRPYGDEEFDSWYAALLCWQPIRPKGAQNRMTKAQLPSRTGSAGALGEGNRRLSDVALQKEPPIIKVGKMFLWDAAAASNSNETGKGSQNSQPIKASVKSQAVSITLRENGELKLHLESDMSLLTVIQLSQLSRCAIQQLDKSVLGAEFCIAIYPQYHSTQSAQAAAQNVPSQPIFVSLESRVQYEVWVVLLRAFTVPQLYGPEEALERKPSNASSRAAGEASRPLSLGSADMFRVERSLSVRVIEARLVQPLSPRPETHQGYGFEGNFGSSGGFNNHSNGGPGSSSSRNVSGFYAEVLLDGEVRAKTNVKPDEPMSNLNLFWREEFEFKDLPAAVSVASIVLKKMTRLSPPPSSSTKRDRDEHRKHRDDRKNPFAALSGSNQHGRGDWDEENNSEAGRFEEHQVHGQVDLFLDDLEPGKDVERWWPLVNHFGQGVGEALVKVMAEENVILMAKDYQPMSEMLHRFPNGLTLQMAQKLPGELKRLSQCLLNIFQVSSSVIEWLSVLIEEEIDGTLAKEASFAMGAGNAHPLPSSVRLRFNNRRMSANENGEVTLHAHHFDRELFLRDMGKSATLEANLLFRGNTILTRSLDLHMKRLGKDYLEETLGDKLREIAERNADCEVDPNRISNSNDLDRNWRKLIVYTSECWDCIAQSALKCPNELRYIFRHIRACAEDRYGDFLRTVSYSSVSGFLFLRFFCPAILNPMLFGLINDHPQNNARRTFTLIAKSLQGLANMSAFGAKEEWMEPMNAFLNSHRTEFKHFLDAVCAVPSSSFHTSLPPPYSTPLAILSRLPPTSREGFLSLPHLIDHAKSFAALVSLWLGSCKNPPTEEKINAEGENGISNNTSELFKFHQECLRLKKRAEDCVSHAERAECPGPDNEGLWEELVEQMESNKLAQEQFNQQQQQQRRPLSPTDALSDEESERDMRDPAGKIAGGLAVRSGSASASTLHQQQYDQRFHPSPSHPLFNQHSRADSAGGSNNGNSKISTANRAASSVESPLSMRPWKGPGRQLSLEILPSSRSGSFSTGIAQKPTFTQTTSSGSIPKSTQQLQTPIFETPQYSAYHTASPGSHDNSRTSPPYANNETMADNNDSHIASGRTSPSQLVRSVADVRIQPRSYGSVVSSAREHDVIHGGNTAVRRLDQNSSNIGVIRSTPGNKERPSTSANASSNAPSDWTSERVFVSGQARGNRHIHVGVQTPQNMPYSFGNPASASSHHGKRDESPSAQHSSGRVPRRDWALEERVRRDERLGRVTGGSVSGTQSPAWGSHLSSAEEEDEEDEEDEEVEEDADLAGDQNVQSGDEVEDIEERQQQRERNVRHQHSHSLSGNSNNITALPPAPKASSSRKSSAATRAAAVASSSAERPMSERPLLERMMFKKRK